MNRLIFAPHGVEIRGCSNNMSTWTDQDKNTGGVNQNDFLLKEDGFYLLLEDSGKIILNEGDISVTWTDQVEN